MPVKVRDAYDTKTPQTSQLGYSRNSVPSTPFMTTKFASLDINDSEPNQTDHASTRGPSPHPTPTAIDGILDTNLVDSAKTFHAKHPEVYYYDGLYDVSDESDPNVIYAISILHIQHIQ